MLLRDFWRRTSSMSRRRPRCRTLQSTGFSPSWRTRRWPKSVSRSNGTPVPLAVWRPCACGSGMRHLPCPSAKPLLAMWTMSPTMGMTQQLQWHLPPCPIDRCYHRWRRNPPQGGPQAALHAVGSPGAVRTIAARGRSWRCLWPAQRVIGSTHH